MAIANYSSNPALNTHINGINIAEGCPPSGINNAIRQIMADMRENYDSGTVSLHAATHKTSGSDPLKASDIGAMPATWTLTAAAPLTGGGTGAANRTIGLGTVPVANGGTGATTASAALASLGAAPASHCAQAATASAVGHARPGAGLSVDAAGTLAVSYGTAAGTACQGNDSRLTNTRAPTVHASTHKTGGADALRPPDIGALAGAAKNPPVGSDLDASDIFWEPGGLWYCTAATTANRPDNVNGFCLVFGTANVYIKHLYLRTSNTEAAASTYLRTIYYSGGLPSYTSPWERLYTSNDLIPLSNGGTGAATAAGALANLGAVAKAGDTVNGTLKVTGEIQTTASRSYRHVCGDYGVLWYSNGSDLFLLITDPGDQYGTYNSLRPFKVNLATGVATISGNAATASTLAAARYIGLSGGATGTPTLFDGSGPITIPVTALDVSKATAGTLPVARGGTGATTAAASLTSLGAASSARTISVSAPLTGGGDLTANRTIGIGSATESAVGVVGLATAAETTAGTLASKAVHPAGLKSLIDSLPFSHVWVSGKYQPVLGAITSATHNLGLANPSKCLADVQVVCSVAEGGYAVGDTAQFLPLVGSGCWGGPQPRLYANTVEITSGGYGIPFHLAHKSTGLSFIPTIANWRYQFRVFY